MHLSLMGSLGELAWFVNIYRHITYREEMNSFSLCHCEQIALRFPAACLPHPSLFFLATPCGFSVSSRRGGWVKVSVESAMHLLSTYWIRAPVQVLGVSTVSPPRRGGVVREE